MTRFLAILALLLTPAAIAQSPAQPPAQQPADKTPPTSDNNPSATISVSSSLVVVPALVKTKSGQLVFTLKADDFIVKDDGVPQTLRLEEDTDSQPLALVVVVEVGGDGIHYLDQYSGLGPLLDAIVGNVPHRVAIVDFDSEPELLHGFTTDLDVNQQSTQVAMAAAQIPQLEAQAKAQVHALEHFVVGGGIDPSTLDGGVVGFLLFA